MTQIFKQVEAVKASGFRYDDATMRNVKMLAAVDAALSHEGVDVGRVYKGILADGDEYPLVKLVVKLLADPEIDPEKLFVKLLADPEIDPEIDHNVYAKLVLQGVLQLMPATLEAPLDLTGGEEVKKEMDEETETETDSSSGEEEEEEEEEEEGEEEEDDE